MEAAAGIFAVIGVADVVLRTGKEVYVLVSSIKNASKAVKELQRDLEAVALLISKARAYLADRATRSSSIVDPDDSLVTKLLVSFEEIHKELNAIALSSNKKRSLGRLSSLSKVKWIFNEKKVVTVSLRLRDHKETLTTILVLEGIRLQQSTADTSREDLQHFSDHLASIIAHQSTKLSKVSTDLQVALKHHESQARIDSASTHLGIKGIQTGLRVREVRATKRSKQLKRRIDNHSGRLLREIKSLRQDVDRLMVYVDISRIQHTLCPICSAPSLPDLRGLQKLAQHQPMMTTVTCNSKYHEERLQSALHSRLRERAGDSYSGDAVTDAKLAAHLEVARQTIEETLRKERYSMSMSQLTVFTVVFFPLTLTTSLFSMAVSSPGGVAETAIGFIGNLGNTGWNSPVAAASTALNLFARAA